MNFRREIMSSSKLFGRIQKMKWSKWRVRTAIEWGIFVFSCLLGIVCVIFELPPAVGYVDAVVAEVCVVSLHSATYCQYCGKHKIIVNPFSANRFKCANCGKERI